MTATASGTAQIIHQVQATATSDLELVTLWANSGATAQVTNTVANIEVTNGSISGLHETRLGVQNTVRPTTVIFSQLPLSGTDTIIHAHSTATEPFFVWGFVDHIATG